MRTADRQVTTDKWSMEFGEKVIVVSAIINLCANDIDGSNSTSSVSSNETEGNDLDIAESVEQQILYAIIMVGETRGEQILTEFLFLSASIRLFKYI